MNKCPKCGLETDNDGWHVTKTPNCRYFYKCEPPPVSRILYSKPSQYDVFPGGESMKKECCPNCALYGVTAYLIEGKHVTPNPLGDIISDECPVPKLQKIGHRWVESMEQIFLQNREWPEDAKASFMQRAESKDQPFTFDELADIGDSIKEKK